MRKYFIWLGLWIVLPAALQASTNAWIGGTGDFGHPANWNAGIIPGTGDVAYFYTNSNITVFFRDDEGYPMIVTNHRAVVAAPAGQYPTATWDLVGGEYYLTSTGDLAAAALYIGGNAACLTVTNGRLHTAGFLLGDAFAGNSMLIISGSNTTWTSMGEGATGVLVGNADIGSSTDSNRYAVICVKNGAAAILKGLWIGSTSGHGRLDITGAGTVVTNTSTVQVGYNGAGRVTVADGGHWSVNNLRLNSDKLANSITLDDGTISAGTLGPFAFRTPQCDFYITLHTGKTNSLLTVTGTATLAELYHANFSLAPGFNSYIGEVFNVLSAGTLSGTFGNLAEGDILTFGNEDRPLFQGYQFRASYTGNNSLTLTTIATPVSGTLIRLR